MMDALEWTASVLVFVGYVITLRYSRAWGAVVGFAGSIALTSWAYLNAKWGLCALNVLFSSVNLYAIIRPAREL